MWRRVNKRWLWVSAGGLFLCAALAFGDWADWWGDLAGDSGNDILDRADKISSVISGVCGVAALIFSLVQAHRANTMSPQPDEGPADRARQRILKFVDRDDESHRLRRVLTDDHTRIIVVHGAAGIGKTELVNQVLSKIRTTPGRHLATPMFSPTAGTILSEVRSSGPASPGQAPPVDGSPIAQLEALLRGRGSQRHIIVLDAVDRLLNADDKLTDLSLDEALELIATGPWHGVKVVLISTRLPRAETGGQWARTAYVIPLDLLPIKHFRKMLKYRSSPLRSVRPETLAEVHRDLGGRPRLAQLFDAIVAGDSSATAQSLAAEVARWAANSNPDRVGDRLRQRMTESFSTEQKRVYRAVAALATPAVPATVAEVVNAGRAPDDRITVEAVDKTLRWLSRYAIHTDLAGWAFFLTSDEARRALHWQAEPDTVKALADRHLLDDAAETLLRRRRGDKNAEWTDPQALLAEVDAALRADLPESAWRSIREMDNDADSGNPAMLFREARQVIAEQLAPREQSANYAVLGYLYHAGGNLSRSRENYRRALERVPDDKPIWKSKILVNIAGLEWSQGSPESALSDFRRALALAPDDPMVKTGALTGMARCYRRQGRLEEAAQHLDDALRVTGVAVGVRIRITVRLLRLRIDQGRLSDAGFLLEQVHDDVKRAQDAALTGAHFEALADLRFAQDRYDDALEAAHQAIEHALPAHDPVTALQARSTISMLQTMREQFPQAAREAQLARRYSGAGSLIVIALQMVACRRAGQLAQAREATRDLLDFAEARTERYQGDFAAWLLLGLGRCAQALETATGSVDNAIVAFRRAWEPGHKHVRPPEPAPGITHQVLMLVKQLGVDDEESRRLRPAVKDLDQALLQQQGTRTRTAGDD